MAIFTFCGNFEDVKIVNFQFKTISDHSRLVKHDSKSVQGQLKTSFHQKDVSQSDLCIFDVQKMYPKCNFLPIVGGIFYQVRNWIADSWATPPSALDCP